MGRLLDDCAPGWWNENACVACGDWRRLAGIVLVEERRFSAASDGPNELGFSPVEWADTSIPPLVRHNLIQRSQQTVHLFHRVVVDEPDAQEASGLFHVEVFGQVERVVVAVPGEEAALAELSCELEGSMTVNADGERAAAVVEARGVGDAVNLRARESS